MKKLILALICTLPITLFAQNSEDSKEKLSTNMFDASAWTAAVSQPGVPDLSAFGGMFALPQGSPNLNTLATPNGWTQFMNPATYIQMMNPATYAQMMAPAFYMQFMNPRNWLSWVNPSAYSEWGNPQTWIQPMNPINYMQFMNPLAYMQMMNPMNYAAFINPQTYTQWVNQSAYQLNQGHPYGAGNWLNPNPVLPGGQNAE